VKRFHVLAATMALLLVPGALASDRHPTLNELENEVMCPVCTVPLAQSDSPAAKQIERVIRDKIAAGWTKSQIKNMLVKQYGESILTSPPKHGFNLLAWLLPLVGIVTAGAVLGAAAWRWSRQRAEPELTTPQSQNGHGPVDPELDRRLDEELARFD
jgi:cytochrome c-type biogenesis protein CcmH